LSGKRSLYFLVFAALPLLLVLQARERSEFLHQISLTALKPFLVVTHSLSRTFRNTGEQIGRFWNLHRNYEELARRVKELEQKQVEMEELQKENTRLAKLLEFKKEIPGKAVASRVIGRDPAPWRKTLLIDKGWNDGIKKKMAVVNAEGLVGRVIEVAPFSSRVILLLDPLSRASGILEEGRDLGVVEGDGSPWLRLTHLDRESSPKVGERVLSSGFGGVYPKGIPIGQVEMVSTEKGGLGLFASVRPFVNFSKLEEVLCVASFPQDS